MDVEVTHRAYTRDLDPLDLQACPLDVPLTETRMVWWTVPSLFLARQRYSPASESDTLTMRSVFWKCRKDVLLAGSSPLTLVQETSGVGLDWQRGKRGHGER